MSSPICGSGAPVEGSDVEDDASIELGPAPTPTVQEKILLLTGRHFPLHFSSGELDIHGTAVFISEVHNTGEGTGLTVWDGAVTLAKHLEYAHSANLVGKTVIELGCGTGVAGIAASIIGAREVILTDLPYVLKNTRVNVERNKLSLKGTVTVAELDWFAPVKLVDNVDYIIGSDVVWVEDLIEPLVRTLVFLTDNSRTNPTILISHQTRSVASDEALFRLLDSSGFTVGEVPFDKHHPVFKHQALKLLSIKRRD